MSKLSYVPSWIDGATTLLEKLNICIAKIESLNLLSEEVNAIKVTSENALSLAQTNEQDISTNDGEIAELQNEMAKTLKLPLVTPTETEVVTVGTNGAQSMIPLSSVGGKLYKHDITINAYGPTILTYGVDGTFLIKFSVISKNNSLFENINTLQSEIGSQKILATGIGVCNDGSGNSRIYTLESGAFITFEDVGGDISAFDVVELSALSNANINDTITEL